MERFWIYLVILLCDNVNGEPNPCFMYKNVSDTDLQKYFSNSMCFPSSPAPAWYRFTSNAAGSMSTDCKLVSACGGTGQVWINDNLPVYSDGTKKVNMCIKLDSCCSQRNQLSVRNCNSFFIFELRRLPKCDIRYCYNKTDIPLVTVATTPTTISTTPNSQATSTSYKSTTRVTNSASVHARPSSPKSTIQSTNSLSTLISPTSTSSQDRLTTTQAISLKLSTLSTVFITSLVTNSTSALMDSSKLASNLLFTTTHPGSELTTKTTDTPSGTKMISHKTHVPTMTTHNNIKTKQSVTDSSMAVIVLCSSIGALVLVVVILVVIFLKYRSKLRNRQYPLPERGDLARNLKFNKVYVTFRTNSTTESSQH